MTTFAHRINRHGANDSICRGCYATVASSAEEADLAAHERTHVCDRAYLFQMTAGPSVRFTQSSRADRHRNRAAATGAL
jgi:hypothetical protein